jgi:predicted MFS family arabinose efflux permease
MPSAAPESQVLKPGARKVLFGGFLGSLAAVGLTVYLFGVFQDALVSAFATDVATLSWAPAIFTAASGLLSPLVGRALATPTRPGLSIRSVMFVGVFAIGLGLGLVSRSTALWSAAAAFAFLVAPGAILLGPLLGQAMVTNWFEASRGWALGIVSAGTTVGGVLVPPLAAILIEAFGWRTALATLGGMEVLLMAPAVAWLVRDRPSEERGDAATDPVALRREEAAAGVPAEGETQTSAELLRDPRLWLIGVTFGLLFSAGMISTVFTVPYASELSVPLVSGALIASLRAGSAAAGKIVLGTASDRYGVVTVLFVVIVTEVVLTGLLVGTRSPLGFAVLGVAIGFVGGSPLPLKAALVGRTFGAANFPAAMGLLQSIAMPFQLLMVPLAGLVYQAVGTYAAVFGLTIPCFALAGVSLSLLARRDRSASPSS